MLEKGILDDLLNEFGLAETFQRLTLLHLKAICVDLSIKEHLPKAGLIEFVLCESLLLGTEALLDVQNHDTLLSLLQSLQISVDDCSRDEMIDQIMIHIFDLLPRTPQRSKTMDSPLRTPSSHIRKALLTDSPLKAEARAENAENNVNPQLDPFWVEIATKDLQRLKVGELKAILETIGLDTSGLKKDLVGRIEEMLFQRPEYKTSPSKKRIPMEKAKPNPTLAKKTRKL